MLLNAAISSINRLISRKNTSRRDLKSTLQLKSLLVKTLTKTQFPFLRFPVRKTWKKFPLYQKNRPKRARSCKSKKAA
ncbi:MAG: hypothetical protein CVV42_17250 [Candidatus Riflebacteria bacterium HGW-Riflebacteria-2]|nr:MAG: hypothetical protein CVV42_17250 [Candidatus Riflebacteria bacterium HGW-Riflebacteria-2]